MYEQAISFQLDMGPMSPFIAVTKISSMLKMCIMSMINSRYQNVAHPYTATLSDILAGSCSTVIQSMKEIPPGFELASVYGTRTNSTKYAANIRICQKSYTRLLSGITSKYVWKKVLPLF